MSETPQADDSNVVEVREAHRINEGHLEDFCRANIDGFSGNLTVRQFQGGQSNPTYLLETDGPSARKYVVRKQPPGTLLASAHQVDREYRVMKALAQTDVPVPEMLALCQDKEILGTDFYVMAHLDGRVIRNLAVDGYAADERRAIYDQMNEVMARLHSVDHEAIGLGDFGRPGNYFERQIGRWTKQYRASQTDDLDAMEFLINYLPKNIPSDDSVSIAHGDYRLENTMFHATEPKLIAVLDWELATIGHPLADVGYNVMLYHVKLDSQGTLSGLDYDTLGIPSENAYIADYCKRTGRDGISDMPFYVAFSVFRLASIVQGVYKRGLDGNASSDKALGYREVCGYLANEARRIIEENS